MRGTDSIDTHILHQTYLTAHSCLIHSSTEGAKVVVQASSLELNLTSVEVEAIASLQFDRAYPEGRRISV